MIFYSEVQVVGGYINFFFNQAAVTQHVLAEFIAKIIIWATRKTAQNVS